MEPTTTFAPTLSGGAVFTSGDDVWTSVEGLKKYDLVLLSRENLQTGNPAFCRELPSRCSSSARAWLQRTSPS